MTRKARDRTRRDVILRGQERQWRDRDIGETDSVKTGGRIDLARGTIRREQDRQERGQALGRERQGMQAGTDSMTQGGRGQEDDVKAGEQDRRQE